MQVNKNKALGAYWVLNTVTYHYYCECGCLENSIKDFKLRLSGWGKGLKPVAQGPARGGLCLTCEVSHFER